MLSFVENEKKVLLPRGLGYLLNGNERQSKQICFIDVDCLIGGIKTRAVFGREITCETTVTRKVTVKPCRNHL